MLIAGIRENPFLFACWFRTSALQMSLPDFSVNTLRDVENFDAPGWFETEKTFG